MLPSRFRAAGRGWSCLSAQEAGVRLAAEIGLPKNVELRLINLDSCCTEDSRLSHPFDRRAFASSPQLRTGLLVPVGRVFCGLFDHSTNEAIAIARPVHVEASKNVTVAPRPPAANSSDVYVSLTRPDVRRSGDVDPVQLTLDGKKPQMLFDGSDRIYAAWYGVRGSTARLEAESKTLRLPSRDLKLIPGRVITVRGDLQKSATGL